MVDPFVSAHSREHRQYRRRVHSPGVQRGRLARNSWWLALMVMVCVETWAALTTRNAGINRVPASGSSSFHFSPPFVPPQFRTPPSKQPSFLATRLFLPFLPSFAVASFYEGVRIRKYGSMDLEDEYFRFFFLMRYDTILKVRQSMKDTFLEYLCVEF